MKCQTHDMLEAAAVQRRRINLSYKKTNGKTAAHEAVVVLDVYTEAGEEYMSINDNGRICHIATSAVTAFKAMDRMTPVIAFP
ncbi:hypothetical protein [Marinicella rhabdoformis]|uniref:hypothetical protein n=1 Tax=Marinicella rhabdoformis TaxID=2580566 RepID=UPI001C551853|nr:hypothetical protein [Marinicella rhabdoformis]